MSAAIATHRAEQVADETKATDAGQRYAQSLFELTIESNQLTKVEADLKALRAMVAESADLRRLIEPGLLGRGQGARVWSPSRPRPSSNC